MKVKVIKKIDWQVNDKIYPVGIILDVTETIDDVFYAYYLPDQESMDFIPKEMVEVVD